jgi:hypothetical protein
MISPLCSECRDAVIRWRSAPPMANGDSPVLLDARTPASFRYEKWWRLVAQQEDLIRKGVRCEARCRRTEEGSMTQESWHLSRLWR